MRLKQGSHYYIAGVFFFAAAFFAAMTAGAFGLAYRKAIPFENPMLSDFASFYAGITPVIVFSFIFGAAVGFLGWYVLFSGLKKNALIGPFRVLGALLLALGVGFAVSGVLIFIREDHPVMHFFDWLRALPPTAAGILLFLAAANRKHVRVPLIVCCAVGFLSMFLGFGYGVALRLNGGYSSAQFYGFLSLFSLSVSIGFLYIAVAFCVAGSENKPARKRRRKKAAEEARSDAMQPEEPHETKE